MIHLSLLSLLFRRGKFKILNIYFCLFVFFFYYRSNLVGTRFTVFNSGVNPKKGGVMSDGSNIREEVAAIIYVSTTEHSHKGPVT